MSKERQPSQSRGRRLPKFNPLISKSDDQVKEEVKPVEVEVKPEELVKPVVEELIKPADVELKELPFKPEVEELKEPVKQVKPKQTGPLRNRYSEYTDEERKLLKTIEERAKTNSFYRGGNTHIVQLPGGEKVDIVLPLADPKDQKTHKYQKSSRAKQEVPETPKEAKPQTFESKPTESVKVTESVKSTVGLINKI
jgi:hypothetical protein